MGKDNSKDIIPDKQEIYRDDKGRFLEGYSGNPAGKIVGTLDARTKFLRIAEEFPILKDGSPSDRDRVTHIFEKMFVGANEGQIRLMIFIAEQLMGKAPQELKHSGTIEGELVISEEVKDAIKKAFRENIRKKPVSDSGTDVYGRPSDVGNGAVQDSKG